MDIIKYLTTLIDKKIDVYCDGVCFTGILQPKDRWIVDGTIILKPYTYNNNMHVVYISRIFSISTYEEVYDK